MSTYNSQLKIVFPGLNRAFEFFALTEKEARRIRGALQRGEFEVEIYKDVRKRVV